MTSPQIKTVDFHFDSICPFTWITSRWLVDAADRAGAEIHWRPMSLAILNDESLEDKARHRFSQQLQRVIHHLHGEGRHDDAGKIYQAIGEALFVDESGEADDDLLGKILVDRGFEELVSVADDAGLDEGVVSEHERAIGLVGDDVGTPTLVFEDGSAIFGPVVNHAPRGEAAVDLLHMTHRLSSMSEFFELKRTRTADLDFS